MTSAWDWRARFYDLREASCFRRGPAKSALFADMRGRVIFVAAGTGTDFVAFPPGMDITAIDISDEMLRRAAKQARTYAGTLRLLKADAQDLPFPDGSFDTAVTSCTMCSVPDPVRALRELHRVLRPEGRLLMFEHVRSRQFLLAWTLDLMTLWTRRTGTAMNRDTLANAKTAGFRITDVRSVYLDIILAVRAVKAPADPPRPASAGHAVTRQRAGGSATALPATSPRAGTIPTESNDTTTTKPRLPAHSRSITR